MADAIRTIDTQHPLTVGVGKMAESVACRSRRAYDRRYQRRHRIHSYDAAVFPTMVADVKARSTKPVLLEEFGWPTGPNAEAPTSMIVPGVYVPQGAPVAEQGTLVGMLAWWYQIRRVHLSYSYDENGWYGLYRRDGSPSLPSVRSVSCVSGPAEPYRNRNCPDCSADAAVSPKKEPLYFATRHGGAGFVSAFLAFLWRRGNLWRANHAGIS
jgi:hypothetical protein